MSLEHPEAEKPLFSSPGEVIREIHMLSTGLLRLLDIEGADPNNEHDPRGTRVDKMAAIICQEFFHTLEEAGKNGMLPEEYAYQN